MQQYPQPNYGNSMPTPVNYQMQGGSQVPQGPQTANSLGRYGGMTGMNMNNMQPIMNHQRQPSGSAPPNSHPQQPVMKMMHMPVNQGGVRGSMQQNFSPDMGSYANMNKHVSMSQNMMYGGENTGFSGSDFPFVPSRGMGLSHPHQQQTQSQQPPQHTAPLSHQSQELNLSGEEDFPALPGTSYAKVASTNQRSAANFMSPVSDSQSSHPFTGSMGNAARMTGQPSSDLKNAPTQRKDTYGLLGLLGVIRMTDPDLNTLALGTDLTTLGLNLNSQESLYRSFGSPWVDTPVRREPEFYIPMCYYSPQPLQSPHQRMKLFSDESLFYIFYSMPKDILQAAAASELFKREWRFHKEHQLWFTKDNSEPIKPNSYIYFDVNTWEKRTDTFVLNYDQLENSPPTIPV